eukprot:7121285-Prymnesium_polylepis.1
MPVFAAWAPRSLSTASICARVNATSGVWIAWTPSVFWAVSATIAVVPKTPRASHALRSA